MCTNYSTEKHVKGVRNVGYSISVGLETASKETVEEVFAGADRDMYARKQLRLENEIEKIEDNIGDFIDEDGG
jgi:uncharacterized Zn finger protein